ncbi:MAG: PAS domain-containing protein, partial [Gemmatimonadales bacterium]
VAVDREWRYAYVNPTAGRLLGKAPEALVGQRIWADFPEAVGRPIDQALRRAFETQEPVVIESQFFPHDRWFLNHVYPSPDGLSIFFDETTEKRRTAQEMEETRLRLELAIEASRIGIWDWDLAAHTIWIRFSSARRRLEPVTTFAGPASAWLDRIHPEDVVKITAARDHHIAERTPSFELEFRTREVDDSWHWTFVSAAAVRDEDDRPTRLLGMHMDITDRKRMEQALIDSREQLRELARSLERAREAERTRVAQEIHDELGQALAVIGMDVAWLEKNHQAPVEARLERTGATRALLADTVKVVRRIATELRPGVLDDLGLAAAIDWQGKEFASRSGIRVTTEVAEVASLEPDAATTVFRLLQESLTNVARHAQALSVHIGLAVEGDELVLTVTDDGIGIRTEPRTGSLGLVGMRERTHSWGGSLAVERAPGRGTRVRASLPVARVLRKAAP